MSSKLSAVARLQILRLLSGGGDHGCFSRACEELSSDWKVLDNLYLDNLSEPPESYLRSHELAMIQRDAISGEDLSFIFSHGEPLIFHACPNSLVPKLIETFQQLKEEPSFLHVTIMCGNVERIEVSPPLYVDRFPCTACRHDATIQTRFRGEMAATGDANMECVVEKFHICSKHLTKQLSLELYYRYWHYGYVLPETARDNAKSCFPMKVTVRVEDPVCGVAPVPSSKVASKSTTMMLVPEYAVEVFGFLDRVHVGSSLLANRRMHNALSDAKGILPVHQLSCEVENENIVSS